MYKIDDDLLRQRLKEGCSVPGIAQEFQCSKQAVYYYIKKHGLKIESRQTVNLKPGWLREQKLAMRADIDIAGELGISEGRVSRLRQKHGIPNTTRKTSGKKPLEIDPGWLKTQKAAGRTDEEIALEVGCSKLTVLRRRRSYGIHGSPHKKREMIADLVWLQEQKKRGRTDKEIAKELGCSDDTVFKERKKYGIPAYRRRLPA